MGIVEVEQNRLRQKEIEVRALVALLAHGKTSPVRWKAERKLEEIAYPEELIDKINQQTLDDMDVVFGDEA
jgi:hypothetical protein